MTESVSLLPRQDTDVDADRERGMSFRDGNLLPDGVLPPRSGVDTLMQVLTVIGE